MAETVALTLQPRAERGSKKAARLRQRGLVPAIVYGHKEATAAVTLPLEQLEAAVRHGTRVFDLQADGKTEKAVITELQWDHLGKTILHVDFKRVSKDERIKVHVPLELRGIAPGVTGGGILDQPLHTLEVECLALSIPDSIRVVIGELQLDQAIHVRDLRLPEGVRPVTDADAVVVQVTAPRAEAAPVAAEATERAEPEVIRPERPAEEAEEKK
jgi:large subunit ribosomal protein L25